MRISRVARMSPLKERILNAVRRAGVDGIAGDDLFSIVYDGALPRYRGGHAGRGESRQRAALKSNVHQLNQQIAGTGYRIVGERCAGGRYRLVRTTNATTARSA